MSFEFNPFYVAGPTSIDHFIMREDELDSIFANIYNGVSVAIYGESGVGKSSILKYIASKEAWRSLPLEARWSETWVIYYNCRFLNRPFSANHFWREVLTETQLATSDDSRLQEMLSKVLERDYIEARDIRRILNALSEGKGKGRLLLMLDDFGAIFEEEYDRSDMSNFLGDFRNLAAYHPHGNIFSIVTTSFKRLNELGPRMITSSPWYNHFAFVRLDAFNETEVQHLLARFFFPDQDVDFIEKVAGRHPALLQNACSLLYNKRQGVRDAELDYNQLGWDFEDQVRPIFHSFWHHSSPTEQMLMMLIALKNLGGRVHRGRKYSLKDLDIIFSQHEKELRDLIYRGLLQRNDGMEEDYAFSSSLMEWWVVKEVEKSKDEIELERRMTVFGQRVSTRQKERLKDIARTVWKNKDAIKDIGRWLIDLGPST